MHSQENPTYQGQPEEKRKPTRYDHLSKDELINIIGELHKKNAEYKAIINEALEEKHKKSIQPIKTPGLTLHI